MPLMLDAIAASWRFAALYLCRDAARYALLSCLLLPHAFYGDAGRCLVMPPLRRHDYA